MHKPKKKSSKQGMKKENFKQSLYYNLGNINEAYATLHALRYKLLFSESLFITIILLSKMQAKQ